MSEDEELHKLKEMKERRACQGERERLRERRRSDKQDAGRGEDECNVYSRLLNNRLTSCSCRGLISCCGCSVARHRPPPLPHLPPLQLQPPPMLQVSRISTTSHITDDRDRLCRVSCSSAMDTGCQYHPYHYSQHPRLPIQISSQPCLSNQRINL